MTPRVSIVCVTFNRREYAVRCLESCVAQAYPNLEIAAVVNPAGDGTEAAIAARLPQVRILRAHRNLGFFPGLNLGIANTSGDYVMSIDDDARFLTSDAIAQMVHAFDEEPELGAVTCNLEGPTETPMAGADRYVHLYTTGFTMMPRSVFEGIGYYPDLFSFSGGESFMCASLWDGGYRVKRLSGVRMHHAKTMDGRYPRWIEDGVRAHAIYALMREPLVLLAPSLAVKLVRTFGQLAVRRRLGPWLRAWIAAAGAAPEALRLRRPIQWRTQRVLWRLRRERVTDPVALEALLRQ